MPTFVICLWVFQLYASLTQLTEEQTVLKKKACKQTIGEYWIDDQITLFTVYFNL